MLFDIGVGIFLAVGVANAFSLALTPFFVLFGIFFVLLPDIDFVLPLFWKGRDGLRVHNHRDGVHFPLIAIPLAALLMSFASPAYVALALFALFLHFLHDSIGIGWGVEWLYPFSRKHFSILALYTPKNKPSLPRRWFNIWRHEDIPTLAETYGDSDWMRNIYLKFHPYAIFELVFFLASVAFLVVRL